MDFYWPFYFSKLTTFTFNAYAYSTPSECYFILFPLHVLVHTYKLSVPEFYIRTTSLKKPNVHKSTVHQSERYFFTNFFLAHQEICLIHRTLYFQEFFYILLLIFFLLTKKKAFVLVYLYKSPRRLYSTSVSSRVPHKTFQKRTYRCFCLLQPTMTLSQKQLPSMPLFFRPNIRFSSHL